MGVEGLDLDNKASLLTAEATVPSNVLQTARNLRFTIEPSLLHDPTQENEQFDPVSPTAKIVGYLRGTDQTLSLSDESKFKEEGKRLLDELDIRDGVTQASMAVLFQSRYHAINAAIASSGPPQVVEFASGISPRGVQWSRMSPGTIYVESDLPQLMIHKAKLIRNSLLAEEEELRGLLHCCAVDVLDENSVFQCVRSLDVEKPFALVTEGLMLYFAEAEMREFFRIMSTVLHAFDDAVWVTDMVTRQNLKELFASDSNVAKGVKQVFSLTGREVEPANPFDDLAAVKDWLAEFNLQVERELPLTSTTARLKFDVSIPQEQRDRIVGSRSIWRIKKRKS